MLAERLGMHYDKYKLITEQKKMNKILGTLIIYIPGFIRSIWNNPKSLATILSVADKKDIKNNLDHFIVHNLYENIFSSNGKQDQLLYIIALLLKEEINNLGADNENELNIQNFLNETACGNILEELLQKKKFNLSLKILLIL